jgi:hypothetical protein
MMCPLAHDETKEMQFGTNGSRQTTIRSKSSLARDRSEMRSFQIIASLRLHNAAGAGFIVSEGGISLEAEAQGKLDRARTANLEEWT